MNNMCSIAPRRQRQPKEEREEKNMLCTRCDLMKHTQKFNLGCDRSEYWPQLALLTDAWAHTLCMNLSNEQEETSICSGDCIASGWPCSKRTNEREKEKGKKKIETHIVPSVTQQSYSRSSNVFAYAHALSQQRDLITTIFILSWLYDEYYWSSKL